MILDMIKPRFPYTLHEKNRHGNLAWYFRLNKTSKRIRLRGDFGTEQFIADYAAAISGAPKSGEIEIAISKKGTLRWLASEWKMSSSWVSTRPTTRRQRENILLHILENNGDLPFDQVDELAILQGRERRATTPSAANNYLKVMRALFGWAKEMRHIKIDPSVDVKFIVNKTDGHEPWNADDVEAYRGRWAIGTRQRLAFETFYWTGLRRGDACRLGKQHIGRDGIVRLRMEKTEKVVSFTLPDQLVSIIAATPCGDLTFISTGAGRPFTKESLGNAFREWCGAAGVKKSAHGIRKLAASEAAQAGASEAELKAYFGWQTNNQSLVYTRSARNTGMATSALEKRGGNVSSANPVLPPANLKKGA